MVFSTNPKQPKLAAMKIINAIPARNATPFFENKDYLGGFVLSIATSM